MQGTILILDGVSTTRIMLKVQLSAAWYHVVPASRLAGVAQLARRVRPDLIITALTLPDGDARLLPTLLRHDPQLAAIPILAIVGENDRAARLRALAAGMDEALCQPLDDRLLQARIRSLIRAGFSAEDLELAAPPPELRDFSAPGLSEPVAAFLSAPARPRSPAPSPAPFLTPPPRGHVALLAGSPATACHWRSALSAISPHQIDIHPFGGLQALLRGPAPDAAVIELGAGAAADAGLRLLADLRARGATRDTAVIAVPAPGDTRLAAEALDRGAHDVMPDGFDEEELTLRLDAQLRRKARSDRLRATLRDGLRAAVRDPMTGLHNRRYAMPRLAEIARAAAEQGHGFAVMLADLDHFKQVNDRHGHPAGDAVLIEAARRLSDAVRPQDLIARMGGEEFLIALPRCGRKEAAALASRLCQRIQATGYRATGVADPIHMTVSIGVALGDPGSGTDPEGDPALVLSRLIRRADRALYAAKRSGRNKVTLARMAAA